jgi:hypothetical protein
MTDEVELVSVTDMPSTDAKEPAVSTGSVIAGGTLLVNGLILFGVPLEPDQKLYIVSLISFLAPLIAGLIIRFKVFSPASVDKIVQALRLEKYAAERTARAATAEAVAARTAVQAAQDTISLAVQGVMAQLPQNRPAAAPEQPQERSWPDPEPEPLRPPSDRVYGLSPAVRDPDRQESTAQPTGYYQYAPEEITPPRAQGRPREAPRGYRGKHGLRSE